MRRAWQQITLGLMPRLGPVSEEILLHLDINLKPFEHDSPSYVQRSRIACLTEVVVQVPYRFGKFHFRTRQMRGIERKLS
jgi:hypothetical protein